MDPLSNVQKTPISLLQEICARHSLTPEYKLISVEGAVHAPIFMYRVEVADVVATATGQSKKKAKHSAAKAILEKLLDTNGMFANMNFSDGSTFGTRDLETVIPDPVKPVTIEEDGVPGNPVGALQELTMKRRWRPPYYETIIEKGLPHERTFEIACYVGPKMTSGIGKSKRLAKREAAHKMMLELEEMIKSGKDINGEALEKPYPSDDIDEISSTTKSELTRHSVGISNHGSLVQKFVEKIRENPDSRLATEIPCQTPDYSYIATLTNVALDQDFDINFIPIKERGFSGKYYCLVQLGSVPLAVCFGSAATPEEAKEESAHNALLFLKVLTHGKA